MDPAVRTMVNKMLIGFWPIFVCLIGILAILLIDIYVYRLAKPWIAKKDKMLVSLLFRFLGVIGFFMVLGLLISSLADAWQSFYWYGAGLVAVILGFALVAIVLKYKFLRNKK